MSYLARDIIFFIISHTPASPRSNCTGYRRVSFFLFFSFFFLYGRQIFYNITEKYIRTTLNDKRTAARYPAASVYFVCGVHTAHTEFRGHLNYGRHTISYYGFSRLLHNIISSILTNIIIYIMCVAKCDV